MYPGLTLLQLPDDNKLQILERCDLRSILVLRKACHDFRNLIDDKKPDGIVKRIEITIEPNYVNIAVESGKVTYRNREMNDGCSVSGYGRLFGINAMFLKDQDYLNVFFKDLENILVYQKKVLKKLSLEIYQNKTPGIIERLAETMRNQRCFLKTENLKLKTTKQSEVFLLLSFIDPNSLEEIEIVSGDSTPYSYELFNSPQWKMAKSAVIHGLDMDILNQCFHFTLLTIHSIFLSFECLETVKRKIRESSTLKFINFICDCQFFPMNRQGNIYRMENNGEELIQERINRVFPLDVEDEECSEGEDDVDDAEQ